jgi:hypothetical protein
LPSAARFAVHKSPLPFGAFVVVERPALVMFEERKTTLSHGCRHDPSALLEIRKLTQPLTHAAGENRLATSSPKSFGYRFSIDPKSRDNVGPKITSELINRTVNNRCQQKFASI